MPATSTTTTCPACRESLRRASPTSTPTLASVARSGPAWPRRSDRVRSIVLPSRSRAPIEIGGQAQGGDAEAKAGVPRVRHRDIHEEESGDEDVEGGQHGVAPDAIGAVQV